MKERLERLRSGLDALGLGCMLVTKIENVRYLSGFTGSSAVALVTPTNSILVTDGRYRKQAPAQAPGWEVRVYTGSIFKEIALALPEKERCGFEVTCGFEFHHKLAAEVDGTLLEPLEGVIEGLRAIKDAGEIELMRAAVRCAAEGFEAARALVRAGVSEREIAAELNYRMTLAGADGPSFDTIVSSGPNSALPHAPLTDRTVGEGDLVVIDFGAKLNGYVSDTTRTFLLPPAGEQARQAFEVVEGALGEVIGALKPGMKAANAEAVAHEYIVRAGFGEHLSHSLGHGVGLEVHEKPTLSAVSLDLLEPGMIFTVEPGAYIEGLGGVRIEELVLMTPRGPELLTSDIRTTSVRGH
jgi:Xaa-Pro aminopeptidase